MSLIKYHRNRFPWNAIEHLDTDNFFVEESNGPAMNIKEREDDFMIELAVPGFDKEDFEISTKDRTLEVSAQKSIENAGEDNGYTRKEFSYSSFKRSMRLPQTVDASKEVKATYKNGILSLDLPKKKEAMEKPKKIIKIS
ncbi:MAG: Hsp20/alpha crystallin family protein [Saonia sp.]